MDKEDYFRLLETAVKEIPNYLIGIAALITAINASKTKKRKPEPHKRKR